MIDILTPNSEDYNNGYNRALQDVLIHIEKFINIFKKNKTTENST